MDNIFGELGNFTTATNINDALDTERDIIENVQPRLEAVETNIDESTSAGYVLVNELIKLESAYAPEQERNYETYTFKGTYTATEIIDTLEEVTTDSMRSIYIQMGFTIVKQESEYNLYRLFTSFTVDSIEDLQFLIQLDDCETMSEMFGLSPSFSSLASSDDGGNIRVCLDFDLSESEYPKIEDRVSRNLIRIEDHQGEIEKLDGGLAEF
jgi:hypothetical protein